MSVKGLLPQEHLGLCFFQRFHKLCIINLSSQLIEAVAKNHTAHTAVKIKSNFLLYQYGSGKSRGLKESLMQEVVAPSCSDKSQSRKVYSITPKFSSLLKFSFIRLGI